MYVIGICDDEVETCASLEENINEYFQARAEKCEVDVWHSAEALRNDLPKCSLDLLLLDIELQDEDGVSLGKYIRNELKNELINIVYISHKTNYAMELFQVHPFDFLVKPISKEVLELALSKVLRLENLQNKRFRYSRNKIGCSVIYGEILFFSSNNKLILIHKANGDVLSFKGKLSDIIPSLPHSFACIGKSVIVNLQYIVSWKHNSVMLTDNTELPISQSKRKEFKTAMFNYILRKE